MFYFQQCLVYAYHSTYSKVLRGQSQNSTITTHSTKLCPKDVLRISPNNLLWTSPSGPLSNAKVVSYQHSEDVLSQCPQSVEDTQCNVQNDVLRTPQCNVLRTSSYCPSCNVKGRPLPTSFGRPLQTLWRYVISASVRYCMQPPFPRLLVVEIAQYTLFVYKQLLYKQRHDKIGQKSSKS